MDFINTSFFSFTMQIVCYISILPTVDHSTFWCARFPQTWEFSINVKNVSYVYKTFNYYWSDILCPRTFVCARFPTHLVNDLIITVYLYCLVNVQPRSDKINIWSVLFSSIGLTCPQLSNCLQTMKTFEHQQSISIWHLSHVAGKSMSGQRRNDRLYNITPHFVEFVNTYKGQTRFHSVICVNGMSNSNK